MNTFKLTIASPDGNRSSDEAQRMPDFPRWRGIEGDLGDNGRSYSVYHRIAAM